MTGIGVDIEEVGRFRKLPYKDNQSFYKQIFTPNEIRYCLSKADFYQHIAARFAAKEAVIKALGDSSVYRVKGIEIINDKKGKPQVKFSIFNFQFSKNRSKLQTTNCKLQILVSMSHVKDYAVAMALVL
ncbi:MAG: holo-ACP synthase [Patescibacteria group bacterium]